MDFRELQKLQRLLALIKRLQKLKELLNRLEGEEQEEEVEAWLLEHRKLFQGLSDSEMDSVREKADYDEEAWQMVLRQLKKN